MKLTQGMFGSEFSPNRTRPLGLACGQMRSRDNVAHNGGWYNKAGEKIGWGDLNDKDILARLERQHMLYYYELNKSNQGPFSVSAESDVDAIVKATKAAVKARDELLCVYDEDFRMVFERDEE